MLRVLGIAILTLTPALVLGADPVEPKIRTLGGEYKRNLSLAPPPQPLPADPDLASMVKAAASADEADPVFATLPTTTVPIDIDWCNPLQSAASLPPALQNFQFCSPNQPLTFCRSKSAAGSVAVEVCGSLTEFRTQGYIKVGGSLNTSFNVTPGRVDLGSPAVYSPCNRTPDPCLVKGFCIAGAPVVTRPAQPAVYYPCNTYTSACLLQFCVVGAPVLVQALPPKFVTCRLVKAAVAAVTETCRLVTPATLPTVVLPSLANLRLTGNRLIESRLTHTVGGNASLEVDVAIPTLGVVIKESGGNPNQYSLGTELLAGLFLHLEAQARGAKLILDGTVDSRGTLDLDWNPSRGWLDRSQVLANRWTTGLQLQGPEQIELLAALRSTLSGEVALQFTNNMSQTEDILKAGLGGYFGPYLDDDWTRPVNRNWRHNIDAGLGVGYQAALSFNTGLLGNFLLPDLRLLSASADVAIVETDVLDYFGRGDLDAQLDVSGQPSGPITVGLKMAPLPSSSGTGSYLNPPELKFSNLLSSTTLRFSRHPQVRDFKAPCKVDSVVRTLNSPTVQDCELVAEEHLLAVTLPNNCTLAGTNPRRVRLQPDASISQTLQVTCGSGGTPAPGPLPDLKLLPLPSALAFHHQAGAPAPAPRTVGVSGEQAAYNVVASKTGSVNWLSATPASGSTPGSFRVSVLPAGLPPGDYAESIFLEPPAAPGQGIEIPVTLNVSSSARAIVSPPALTLETITGAVAAVSGSLSITSSGAPLNLSVAATGGAWLAASSSIAPVGAAGSAPSALTVRASPAGLGEGTHSGTVRLTAPGALPVSIPVTLAVRSNRLAISQVADGDNWRTTIILVNTDQEPAPFTIRFYDANGQPIAIDLEGIGRLAEYSATILVGGSHIIETDGTSPTLRQGWAEVTAQRSIGGRAIFRQQVLDGAESEAGVPLGSVSSGPLLLPFDNTQGFVTSAALLNANPSAASTLMLRFRDEDGQILSTESLALRPRSRETFEFPSRFRAVAGRRGVVEISASTPGLAVLGLRFNPRGSFTSFEAIVPQAAGGESFARTCLPNRRRRQLEDDHCRGEQRRRAGALRLDVLPAGRGCDGLAGGATGRRLRDLWRHPGRRLAHHRDRRRLAHARRGVGGNCNLRRHRRNRRLPAAPPRRVRLRGGRADRSFARPRLRTAVRQHAGLHHGAGGVE